MGSRQISERIVQHPYVPFDPTPGGGYARCIELERLYEEPRNLYYKEPNQGFQVMPNQLFHEKFRMHDNIELVFLQDFMNGCLNFFTLTALPDEILWHDTGYWSIRKGENQFMGMGLNSLDKAIEETKSDEILFCLSNRDSIIILHGTLKGKSSSSVTYIDAYSTNAFLPFAEVADIYRNGLKSIGNVENVKAEFILESALHSRFSQNRVFVPHVEALVMMNDIPVLATIRNPMRMKACSITALDYILVATGGTDLKSRPTDFRLIVDQWTFENGMVFQFYLREFEKMKFSFLEAFGKISKTQKLRKPNDRKRRNPEP